MKKIIFFLLITLLWGSAYSQKTTTQPTKKTAQAQTNQKGKKVPIKEPPKQVYIQLPSNSNDCFFAVDLKVEPLSNLIAAPKGSGYIMEITRDSKNPELFEVEHNTVWYTFVVPYSGKLLLDIVPETPTDDYDFLLYKSTDQYFCNKIENKRVKPILSNLSAPNPATKGAIGISLKANKRMVSKKSTDAYVSSIDVIKGEVYYLVVDDLTSQSKGYRIGLNVYIDGIKPTLCFIDERDRKPIPADVLLIEKGMEKDGKANEDRIVINKKDFSKNQVVLVPGFTYTLYAQKEGYFSYNSVFNSERYLTDTITIPLKRIVKGAKFSLTNVAFLDTAETILESKEPLAEMIQMMLKHEGITIEIKGYMNPYEREISKCVDIAKQRAEAVMQAFVDSGVAANRMKAIGMTVKEAKELLETYLVRSTVTDKNIEIIIMGTGVGTASK